MASWDNKRVYVLLFTILILAGIFRIPNLQEMPHWAWDEGANMNIASNLAEGKMQWFSLEYSFVPHPPLFFMLVAPFLNILGNQLLVMRALTVLIGLCSVLLLYLIGTRFFNKKLALAATFLYAIYPHAVYFGRMAFANNLLVFLVLLSLFFFLRYEQENSTANLYLSGFSASLAFLTEFPGITAILSVLFLARKKKTREFMILFLSVSIAPLAFVFSMLSLTPDYFLQDLAHNFGRFRALALILIFVPVVYLLWINLRKKVWDILGKIFSFYKSIAYDLVSWETDLPEKEKKKRVMENLRLGLSLLTLMLLPLLFQTSGDGLFFGELDYFWMGIFGLGIVYFKDEDRKEALFAFFLPLFAITAAIGRLDHMIIPLYPFFCLGLSYLLTYVHGYLTSVLSWIGGKKQVVSLLVLLLIALPFFHLVLENTQAFILKQNSLVESENIESRREVASFVNERTEADDLVICDSHLTRMIDAKTTVIIQSMAYEGKNVSYMSGDYPNKRFVYNTSYKKAEFIIVRKQNAKWLSKCCFEILRQVKGYAFREFNGYLVYYQQ